MLKSIFLILGSLISNRIFSSLLYSTARPMARDLVRRSVKFTARVITVCLIGALAFAAGLVMTFIELGSQLSEAGVVYFSPPLWFGLGMLLIGAVFVYVGAYSNLLSPWKRVARRERAEEAKQATTFSHFIESLIDIVQERAEVRKQTRYRAGHTAPPTSYTPPPAQSQTNPGDYSGPIH